MPGKTRPYEQFGPYILFRKLESDALGELWRAARIEDRHLGPLTALRRFTGGDREALAGDIAGARAIVQQLEGTTFVRGQVADIIDGVPYLAHDYEGGRSLRHIVDRARGGPGISPNPIPIDQAILIAEKVALSLETTGEMRQGAARLAHGALIPQFVWITDDGEIRVCGQFLGKGLLASFKDGKVGGSLRRYFSPDYQHSGEPTLSSEVFSLGAILFLLVTGNEPPDAASVSAFSQAVRAAKTMAGQPLPDDVRGILEKSLVIDPARRYESPGSMKQALAALAHGGKYAGTTFNLAFYLSTLLKKELEGEAVDREKESKVNIAPYLETVIAPLASPAPALPVRAAGRRLLPIAAIIALAALGGGAYIVMKGSTSKANAQPAPAAVRSSPKPAPPPVVSSQPAPAEAATPGPQATATADPAAQQKAFEAAVNQKLQEEMAKLQADFNKEQERLRKAKPAPAVPEALASSAAPQRRSAGIVEPAPAPTPKQEPASPAAQTASIEPQPQTVPAPLPIQPVQAAPAPAPAPAPAAPPSIHEGDVVNFDELDVRPEPIAPPHLIYPPLAERARIEASLILTVFVSESGQVLDVKVLRGDARFGFNDEAIRALRAMRFRPAMKDGKRVRTWIPQPIQFKLQ